MRSTSSSASSRSRTSSTTARSASRSPIRRTSTRSTSSGSRPASRSRSASPDARTSRPNSAGSSAPPRPSAPAPWSRRSWRARSEEEADDLEVDDGISDAPLVRLVNSVIFQAAEDGASDIHFEPQEDSLVVRFRIDGVLQEVQRIPKRMTPGVTTRLKVLAKLDIAERRKPQDGRISLNAAAAGRMLDVRVATLPTVEGESVVMRLLDKSKKPPTLEALGLSVDMQAKLSELVMRPTGALLVTGPTGSGKSTTLYAALSQINRPEINIITVEDPVEYRLAGINQVQINPRAGLTFASALRWILRSDPDVVMVGEVRDGETAKMAIEAALTGHFVLSTLHTNDAPGALAAERDGRRALPRRRGRHRRARAAPRAKALHALLRDVHAVGGRADQGARLARRRRRLRRDGLLPQARLPALQPVRIQGADRRLPVAHHVRAARVAGRPEGLARGPRSARPSPKACEPSGTTAWPRSPPASRRSKSSPAFRSEKSRSAKSPAPPAQLLRFVLH